MASRSSNRAAVPEAKSALDRFKYEVASEIGVPLKDGYNGDLTSRQNGSVGGYMVKKNDRGAGETDVRQIILPQIILPQIILLQIIFAVNDGSSSH